MGAGRDRLGEPEGSGKARREPAPIILCALPLQIGGSSFPCEKDAHHDGAHQVLACWENIDGRTRTTTAAKIIWQNAYDIGREDDVRFERAASDVREEVRQIVEGEA